MIAFQDQISAATKSQLESQLALFSNLTAKTFEGVEKFIDLNLNVARASLEESAAAVQQLIAAKDMQEFLSLTAAQTQPNAEKALAYGRHLAGIATGVQSEYTKAAEAQFEENNRKVIALIEELSKNAPAGSENVLALFKSAVGNVNAGYEQLSKTTKQAVEAMEANINNVATQVTQATAKASRAAGKK